MEQCTLLTGALWSYARLVRLERVKIQHHVEPARRRSPLGGF